MKKIDQRTKITKMLLRQALTQLLKQKPIQSISIKELCECADINRGTFYAHYQDIFDLLAQLEDEMIEDFKVALEPLLENNIESINPYQIASRIFKWLKKNADLCAVTLGEFGDKRFAHQLIELGRDRVIASYSKFFKETNPTQLDYYYTFVSAGCIGLLEKWLHDGMTTSEEEIASIAEKIMFTGLSFLKSNGTPKAITK